MVKQGAALLIPQKILTAEKLAEVLLELAEAPERCQLMGEAAYQVRQVDAAERVLTICKSLVEASGCERVK